MNANVTGSGNIKGYSKLKEIDAHITGSGEIGGFYIDRLIKARVTGSGNIKLSYCKVDKKVIGSGKVLEI